MGEGKTIKWGTIDKDSSEICELSNYNEQLTNAFEQRIRNFEHLMSIFLLSHFLERFFGEYYVDVK